VFTDEGLLFSQHLGLIWVGSRHKPGIAACGYMTTDSDASVYTVANSPAPSRVHSLAPYSTQGRFS